METHLVMIAAAAEVTKDGDATGVAVCIHHHTLSCVVFKVDGP